MDTVKEMLDAKGRGIWSIEASQSVYQAIEKMAEMEVGALTVLDGKSRLAGIVSERDYARKVILKNKSSRETHVADVMTTEVPRAKFLVWGKWPLAVLFGMTEASATSERRFATRGRASEAMQAPLSIQEKRTAWVCPIREATARFHASSRATCARWVCSPWKKPSAR